ncbi:MAG: endopeptidase La [Chitinophagales bacterium]|nr:endopeptidase La [Chitinophagales bacterium]
MAANNNEEDVEYMPLVSLEDEPMGEDDKIATYGDELPVLILRNTVLFPGVVLPIAVGREKSIKAVKSAVGSHKHLVVLSQKNAELEDPQIEDLYDTGTIARVVKNLKMPDGSTTIIIHGRSRCQVQDVLQTEPYYKVKINTIPHHELPPERETKALTNTLKELAGQVLELLPSAPAELGTVLKNMGNPEFLLYFIASNLNISIDDKQKLLLLDSFQECAETVLEHLTHELQLLELKNEIQNRVRTELDKQQRDYFLQQQIKTIQEELGEDSENVDNDKLLDRSRTKHWSKEVEEVFMREFAKMKRLNPMVPDHASSINYLELLLDLPWNDYSKDNFDLRRAQKVLDKDHYGLEKIKRRIIEHLAVLKLKGDMKSPILCFVGPPGVGKTSLGKSIAKALNRQYARISLGGLHDESEIRGHRRTYIGSMPGRVIQSIKKVKTSNPVFILDEIDKVGSNFRGDPASALLEVLDPEQNNSFHDNYLEVEYDLSKVMFIATANSLSTIHPALRDRMEIINLSGYSLEEKLEIAKKHLIPKQLTEHGLDSKQIKFSDAILKKIVTEYTREAGVRTLERRVAALMRWVAKWVAMEENYNPKIAATDVEQVLGVSHLTERYTDDNPPGVAVGLAWTEAGGDILFIETSLSKGKGQLTLTGNLGDVMKESATTALSYIRAHATQLQIDIDTIDSTNIHLHIPEGAIPKDGPSAGITMFTAILSAFTQRKVKPYMAMSGEITLRGKILPVGGIKEKVLAAKRAGLTNIILSQANQRDIKEINTDYLKGLQFTYINNMNELYQLALV